MKTPLRTQCSHLAVAVLFALATAQAAAGAVADGGLNAQQILNAAGIRGGFIVHIGCGDGKLTASLGAGNGFIVHGLDAGAEKIREARAAIRSRGLSGKVSVDSFNGRQLPYIDNLVNLVYAENLGRVDMSEVMRVLCPNGVAYVRSENRWVKKVKPWPQKMDEWTHYLHDPQGTMVGQDAIVGLPRQLQWVGGPKWLRNHDFMASFSAMVSSSGRIFYIVDEGLRNHIYLPARWVVVARDAFNGTVLWKRRVDEWFPHTWPFKSGPSHLPRRLVAKENRVYVTLGLTAPLSVLDGATGRTIRTFDQTRGTEEIVLSDSVLYLAVDPDKKTFPYQHETSNRGKERDRANRAFGWSKNSPPRLVMAVSAESGEVLWKHKNRVGPLTLAVKGQQVFFHDGEHIVALDCGTGKQKWISETAGLWITPTTGYAPRLIAGDGVVLLSTKKARGGRLVGVSAETGTILWKSEQPRSGHFSPEDLFLINGVVWTAQTGGSQRQGTHFVGIDATTGEKRHDFVSDQIEAFFMHQRCYPGRATERFIMTSGTGTEMLEVGTKKCELHHWLRGACIYGIMPCNGLLYKTPDSCACFYQSKLAHFCALGTATRKATTKRPKQNRLEKGPAYGKIPLEKAGNATPGSWPTYRQNNGRSGATATSVPAELETKWSTRIGGRLSTLTAADGVLYVAAIDEHTIHALAADSGKKLWSYQAGGRINSPPTIHSGLALFGCADGWVYCLRTADGALVWRFRAAPGDDKLLSYQHVESVWPVQGSVLIRNGVAYCLAGRNLFVDGGMRMIRLECATGKLLSETVMDDTNPETGKNLQTLMAKKAVPVANADLLSADGTFIYMGAQRFDFEGHRVDLAVAPNKERDQGGAGRHLFCPTGFLDELWFHRSYWIYGKNAGEGHGEYPVPRNHTPTGRIMVFEDSTVYSFFAQNVGNNINPRTSYSVYAADRNASVKGAPAAGAGDRRAKKRAKRKGITDTERKARKKARAQRKAKAKAQGAPKRRPNPIPYRWELAKPELLANAMVLAGRNLFLAGPPDVADEQKTYGFLYGANAEINRQLRRQEDAWRGKEGALIWVINADTGQKRADHKLRALPVWDGMIAAKGRLYLALKDGSVQCLGGR